jgi:hypothetical protein
MSFGLSTVNVNELALLPHPGEMECLGNQDALTSQTTNHCVNPCPKISLQCHPAFPATSTIPTNITLSTNNHLNEPNKLDRFTQINPEDSTQFLHQRHQSPPPFFLLPTSAMFFRPQNLYLTPSPTALYPAASNRPSPSDRW